MTAPVKPLHDGMSKELLYKTLQDAADALERIAPRSVGGQRDWPRELRLGGERDAVEPVIDRVIAVLKGQVANPIVTHAAGEKTYTIVRDLSGNELLAYMGTDAVKWAACLAGVLQEREGVDVNPAPGELLHGWLCNAIGAGESAGHAHARSEYERGLQDGAQRMLGSYERPDDDC